MADMGDGEMAKAKKKREFLRLGVVAAAAIGLAACSVQGSDSYPRLPDSAIQVGVPQAADSYAMDAIMAGDYAAAEAELRDPARYASDDPFRLINLALVLQRTGREAEAALLYNRILALQGNPTASLASGSGKPVKEIARTALASLEQPSR